jgi:hypothetical protein
MNSVMPFQTTFLFLFKRILSLSLSLLAINSRPCLEREVFVAQKEIRIRRTASLLKETLAFTLSK